jgi:plasmid stability protein
MSRTTRKRTAPSAQPKPARATRVVGRTATAGFEAGARRTLELAPETLWRLVTSAEGQRRLGSKAEPLRPDSPGVTTFVEGSHYRRQVSALQRRHSTLQVRVLTATGGRSTLALHREQLSNAAEREEVLKALRLALQGFSPPPHERSTTTAHTRT